MARLYAAGEDTGGVHGANRLGGNGVANSTVFGGLAGQAMTRELDRSRALADPDRAALEAAVERAYAPLGRPAQELPAIREALYEAMWDDVGILRTAEGLTKAQATLADLAAAVARTGAGQDERRYNLTWMDRLNLENLVMVSQAICASALAREDSRGAHFREDFPETSDLNASHYTVVRMEQGELKVGTAPVHFTRVRPGQTLIDEAA